MLAGIYTLSPLQGSIDLLSTTLHPSSTPVPVFAPSSHPIPVIVPSSNPTNVKKTSSYLSKLQLPSTFQLGDSRTVLLVREHDCGLQGLKGGIVPGFSNIWSEDRGSWGLKTINPVCIPSLESVYLIVKLTRPLGNGLRYEPASPRDPRIVVGTPSSPLSSSSERYHRLRL